MSPPRLEPFRLLLATLVLGAGVAGSGACTPLSEDIGEPSVHSPGSPTGGTPGTRPDGGSASPDGGQSQEPSAGLLFKLLEPRATYAVQTRQQVSDAFLGGSAAELASSGYVVTAITPGPDGHALVGVKLSDSGSQYEVASGRSESSTLVGLQALAEEFSSGGYLVTSASMGGSGTTLVGVRRKGVTRPFEAKVSKAGTAAGVPTVANALGAEGYAVTALAKVTDGYLLVGVREQGSTRQYTAATRLTEFSELQAAASSLTAGGYVPTGLGSEGTKTLLLGVKPTGATATYSASVSRMPPSGLTTAVAELASRRYMLAGLTFDGTNHVLIGIR
jgi:hypothetical protein